MPPSGADSAIFKHRNPFCVHYEKGFVIICLIHHFYGFTFLYVFITRVFFSFCLFNDAGFILCSDLFTAGKDVWTLSCFYGINAWTPHCPHKGKHPSCERHSCMFECQRMFFKVNSQEEKNLLLFFLDVILRFHVEWPDCSEFICPLKRFSFFPHQLSPLNAFLPSFSEECFGAGSVWGFWCFTELLWKKTFLDWDRGGREEERE